MSPATSTQTSGCGWNLQMSGDATLPSDGTSCGQALTKYWKVDNMMQVHRERQDTPA